MCPLPAPHPPNPPKKKSRLLPPPPPPSPSAQTRRRRGASVGRLGLGLVLRWGVDVAGPRGDDLAVAPELQRRGAAPLPTVRHSGRQLTLRHNDDDDDGGGDDDDDDGGGDDDDDDSPWR
jgi:hypothetical protein